MIPLVFCIANHMMTVYETSNIGMMSKILKLKRYFLTEKDQSCILE